MLALVVDTVGDGLSDLDVCSGDYLQLSADIGHQFFFRAFFKDKGGFDFGYVDAEGMFVEFGSSGFAAEGLDFGDGEEELFGHAAYLIRFVERDAGHDAHVYREGSFVELR